MSGIQYFHDCHSAAIDDEETDDDEEEETREVSDDADMNEIVVEDTDEYSEDRLRDVISSQTPLNELIHGRIAVEIGRRGHVFEYADSNWTLSTSSTIRKVTAEDLNRLSLWKTQLMTDVDEQRRANDVPFVNEECAGGSVQRLSTEDCNEPQVLVEKGGNSPEAVLQAVDPTELKDDQR
jgi:hypothetical protein